MELGEYYQTPLYKAACRYSEHILDRWNLLGLAHGTEIGERRRILYIARAHLRNHPSDCEFSIAVGLIHDAVSTLAWNERVIRSSPALQLPINDLPFADADSYQLLRAVAADILVHFVGVLEEFAGEDLLRHEEFSAEWLYVFHCAIAQSASRCLEYLDIHVPADLSDCQRYHWL